MSFRILMIGWEFPPCLTGGLGTACHGLASGLAQAGHTVTMLLPGEPPPEPMPGVLFRAARLLPESPDVLPWPGSYPAQRNLSALFAQVTAFHNFARQAAGRDFDVVHCHDWMTAAAGIAVARVRRKPVVLHVHSLESDRSGAEGDPLIAAVERWAVRAADAVVAVSRTTRVRLVAEYGVPAGRVHVVHNGVLPMPAATRTSRKPGLPPRWGGRLQVLFLGRLAWQKGPDLFLRAAAQVAGPHPDVDFIMAGTGDLSAESKRLAAELGLGERVFFPGFVSPTGVPGLLASVDLLAMSSRAEPFGMAALEAAAAGRAVIVPDAAGAAEVLPAACRFATGSAQSLAEVMSRLLSDAALRQRLAAANRRAAARLTWGRAAEKVARFYAGLAKSQSD